MTFQSQPQFWERTHQHSQHMNARPALLCAPNRQDDQDGIVVFDDKGPFFTITIDAALRLAHQIADIVTTMKERNR